MRSSRSAPKARRRSSWESRIATTLRRAAATASTWRRTGKTPREREKIVRQQRLDFGFRQPLAGIGTGRRRDCRAPCTAPSPARNSGRRARRRRDAGFAGLRGTVGRERSCRPPTTLRRGRRRRGRPASARTPRSGPRGARRVRRTAPGVLPRANSAGSNGAWRRGGSRGSRLRPAGPAGPSEGARGRADRARRKSTEATPWVPTARARCFWTRTSRYSPVNGRVPVNAS